MQLVQFLLNALEIIALLYLGVAALYLLWFAVLAHLAIGKPASANPANRFAVFIPAYKEDGVIVEVAQKALDQDYPALLYDVIVIADSLQPATLEKLRALPIKVVEVAFEKSTKSKALNAAMQQVGDNYTAALILDADNVMQRSFLTKINESMMTGALAVQGRRAAKNTNTPFAVLDAASEAINNNIYNQGHKVAGLSARLVGSAMAFDYAYFKSVMKKVDAVGGFDKELELRLLRDRIFIDYRHDAVVFDEKVAKSEVFGRQRTRWIAAQFHYFRTYFPDAVRELVRKGNFDYFNKAYQMMLPPRLLMPGLLLAVVVLAAVAGSALTPLWVAALVSNVLANAISIPRKLYNKKLFAALLRLPKAFLVMVLAMFRLRGANKTFIHTAHGLHS